MNPKACPVIDRMGRQLQDKVHCCACIGKNCSMACQIAGCLGLCSALIARVHAARPREENSQPCQPPQKPHRQKGQPC